jgi:predicted nucleic acid-binding protein
MKPNTSLYQMRDKQDLYFLALMISSKGYANIRYSIKKDRIKGGVE